MEAVFTKDAKNLFSDPPTPKSHYHPTTPRAQSKKITLTFTGRDGRAPDKAHLETAHTLNPIQPPPVTLSPPSTSSLWDVRLCPTDVRLCPTDMRELGDASSDGSSKFDESWPSTSEGGKRDGSPRGREGEVGVAQEVKVGVAPEVDVGVECHVGHHLTAEEKSANTTHDSTLGSYIERFRHAPPTSRAQRDPPLRPFWWKSGDRETTPPQDASTPSSVGKKSGVSSHTHTDPSPGVSSETSLESRSQDLIEKSLTALSETDSPPAQKYLNTRATREAKLTSQPIQNISLAQDSRAGCRVQTTSSDDILVQWRLRRKLEQARDEAAASRFYRPAVRGHASLPHPAATLGHVCNPLPSHMCRATPPQCVCCGESVADVVAASSGQRQTPARSCQCGMLRAAVLKEQEVQTSPGLLDKGGHTHLAVRPLEQEVSSEDDHTPQGRDTRQDDSPLPSPETTPSTTGERVPPSHGGLALRETTLTEDTPFTMTFNTETDLDTSTGDPHQISTPARPHRHHGNQHPSQESVLESGLSPCSPGEEAPTSKDLVSPPQRAGDLASGFLWEDDMGDELLKLLIAKAKLFEAQIREVDGWLMALPH